MQRSNRGIFVPTAMLTRMPTLQQDQLLYGLVVPIAQTFDGAFSTDELLRPYRVCEHTEFY